MSTNDENSSLIETVSDDPNAPLKAGLRYGSWGLLVLVVVGLLVWWPFKGTPGLWGVLIGAAVGGGFVLTTAVSILVTIRLSPSAMMGALMGSWVVKMLIAIIVTASIRNMDFYDKGALVSMLIGAIVAVLGAELWGVLSTRTTYTNPVTGDEADDSTTDQ
ncbi:hypothetical protein [Gordonia zhaorongruii]|uniref:hypothetical protein n=1 Tax=Gordonia zhaorongruii TaxID=2597659 RepID=UPI001F349A9E|nr:hypothetical protein [Gordonia zhaorongruii]